MKKFPLFFVVLFSFCLSVHAEEARLLSVRGEGELKVKPDIAIITLNVRTKAKDAKSAQKKNADEMARVQKVLRDSFQIDTKHIQTSGYSVNPDYSYEQGKQRFLGFNSDHSLIVVLRKLDQAGDLLDKLVTNGSEDMTVVLSGIQFDTEKRKEYELQALELAMKNAELRAQTLAKFAKRNLRGVRRISDSNVSYRPFVQGGMSRMALSAESSAGAPTQVSSGEIVVTTSVAVDYDME